MTLKWEVKSLRDVCEKASSNVSQNQLANETGKHPIFGAGGFIKNVSFYHQDKEYVAIIKDGAGIGRLSLLPAYSSVIGTLQYLVPKDVLDIRYFFYYLSSIDFNKYKNGSTIPHIYFRDYSVEPILVLPLAEQKRIVAVLDEAFDAIAKVKENADKNLTNARELFELYSTSIFTNCGSKWMERTFSEVCEIASVLVDPRIEEYLNLKHVGGANIVSKTGELINLKTSKEEGLISGKFLFDSTMVLYSKIRPYLMKVAQPTFKGLCSADIYPLSPKAGILDRKFLFHLLMSAKFTEYANTGSARAGMPKINRDHLFAYRFMCPPLLTQKEIASKLDVLRRNTDELESVYKQKIADLEELKKSILQKAFSGEHVGANS
ncbi:MAG: hypothetical protein A2X35_09175 [Elusimicrobia bacterium GWA2_61_42]|nr:MAG: hypothetical protein A2X35_09175 [Elusimicrobia bacterium GWA2_61_42]